MFQLDYKSKLPIYEQLMQRLKQLAIQGVLKPHDQLPSVRQLAVQITVNPNTIQKAYRELETQGYIYTVAGKGAFVAPQAGMQNPQALDALDQSLEACIVQAAYLGIDYAALVERFSKLATQHFDQN